MNFINFPKKRLKYYEHLEEGKLEKLARTDAKEALGKSFYSGGGKTGFLRRLSFSLPSPVVVTHPAMPATDLCHPTINRPLSVEEYKEFNKYLMTFILLARFFKNISRLVMLCQLVWVSQLAKQS